MIAPSFADAHVHLGLVALEALDCSLDDAGSEAACAVVPDRPVLLLDSDRHGGWANSRALAVAGIDRTTPDPPDGRIVRRADGEPQGTLREGAVDLVGRVAPEPSAAAMAPGIRAAADHLISLGVTGWQEAALTSFGSIPDFRTAIPTAPRACAISPMSSSAAWSLR